MGTMSFPASAWGLPSCAVSCPGTAGGCGLKAKSAKARRSILNCQGGGGVAERSVRVLPPLPAKAPGRFGLPASLVGMLLPFAAFAVQWTFWGAIGPYAWFLFYPTVFFAPLFGGLWSGVAATVVSTLLAWYVFIPTEFSFRIEDPISVVSIALFAAMGVVFSLFHEHLRRLALKVAQAVT